MSSVSFEAPPNSVCRVRDVAVDPSKAMTVYGDDLGVVRLQVAVARVTGQALAVVCNEGAANHFETRLDLTVPATFRHIDPPTPNGREIRPALGAERDSMTTAELLRGGYPPRPDADKNPKAYERWSSIVSRPMQVVNVTTVDAPIHADPETDSSDTHWGGTLLTNGPYYLSDIFLWVPHIPASPAGHVVIWGGLGGAGGDCALIQNGVDLQTDGTLAQYHGFYEYAPNGGHAESNFSVNADDGIEAWSYPTDDNLNWNAIGTHGCFCFNNVTQGTTTCSSTRGPDCAARNSRCPAFIGPTEETIIEPQTPWMPNTGIIEVDGYGWGAGGRYADMSTDPYDVWQLNNKAGAANIEITRINNQGDEFAWLNGSR